jgi:selenide,water dikinase
MKRLVLLGGGHAHVQVMRAFGREPPPDCEVVLVNRSRLTPYSGMVPGLVAGHYTHAECHIDLAHLSAYARIRLIEQEVVTLDPAARGITCRDGTRLEYDLLAIDSGSTPPLDTVRGAREHATPIKPLETFLAALPAIATPKTSGQPRRIVVVGAGAAGVEIVLALHWRLGKAAPGVPAPELHLIAGSPTALPAFPAGVQRRAGRLLDRAGIHVHRGARVAQVGADALTLADGRTLAVDHTVWITGAAAAPMIAASGLATDERGFIAVDACLRSISHANVYASGDVATVAEHPRPKAGVFAVRQGPPLTRNLRLALAGRPVLPFVPQRKFLVILGTGAPYAIATRGSWSVEGAWVWRWKDSIDRRFMRGFSDLGH